MLVDSRGRGQRDEDLTGTNRMRFPDPTAINLVMRLAEYVFQVSPSLGTGLVKRASDCLVVTEYRRLL